MWALHDFPSRALLPHQPWIVPIPGTTKLNRLEENLGAVNVELTADDLTQINDVASTLKLEGSPPSGSCVEDDRTLRVSSS